jgi:NAD(P)-dependent dehydrogenase (short-subunit alcohol dehydrogenase family)
VLAVSADNVDHDVPAAVVAQTVEAFGRLDILVNNAQIFRTGKALEDITEDDMLVSFESGFFATWRYMIAALPHLKDTQGSIVNMSPEPARSRSRTTARTGRTRRPSAESLASPHASGVRSGSP